MAPAKGPCGSFGSTLHAVHSSGLLLWSTWRSNTVGRLCYFAMNNGNAFKCSRNHWWDKVVQPFLYKCHNCKHLKKMDYNFRVVCIKLCNSFSIGATECCFCHHVCHHVWFYLMIKLENFKKKCFLACPFWWSMRTFLLNGNKTCTALVQSCMFALGISKYYKKKKNSSKVQNGSTTNLDFLEIISIIWQSRNLLVSVYLYAYKYDMFINVVPDGMLPTFFVRL